MQCEVFAGERGYYAVAVDISGVPKLWGSPAYMYYTDDSVVSDENMPDPNEKCWSKRKSGDYRISIFARKKTPPELTVEVARSVFNGDKEAIDKTRNILRRYKDNKVGSGYDGLYIIKYVNATLTVMGVSARTGKTKTITNVIIDSNDKKKAALALDKALCLAAQPFDEWFPAIGQI